MKEIIALQEYTDKYVSFYEGEIRNIQDGIADKLIEEGIVEQHGDNESGQGGDSATNIVNGSASGSVRTIGAIQDNPEYEMGANAFACGSGSRASGPNSHAEGASTEASGGQSHAEGGGTKASGSCSHAEGSSTIANHKSQHVIGEYNIADPSTAANGQRGNYVCIIGNGTSDNTRSNALAIKWDGTFVFANGTEITPAQFSSLLGLLNSEE